MIIHFGDDIVSNAGFIVRLKPINSEYSVLDNIITINSELSDTSIEYNKIVASLILLSQINVQPKETEWGPSGIEKCVYSFDSNTFELTRSRNLAHDTFLRIKTDCVLYYHKEFIKDGLYDLDGLSKKTLVQKMSLRFILAKNNLISWS